MFHSRMNNRTNVLKAIRFERPEYIPMVFHINAAWKGITKVRSLFKT